jgi:hypothetical protein
MGLDQADDTAEAVAQALAAVEIIARALHVKDARLQSALDAIVTHAAAAHPAASDAGLIPLSRGELVPQATTGRAPQVLDLKQQETGKGPMRRCRAQAGLT